MGGEFYDFVKENIKGLPCSGSFDFSFNTYVKEEDFITYINKVYPLTLINFEQDSTYHCFPPTKQRIEDRLTYHYKINNQIYFEYCTFNPDTSTEVDEYRVLNMVAFSSVTNQIELEVFLEYISEYIKNNK